MASPALLDLRQVFRGFEIPIEQIQAVVELLDEGNTVPFITRYRKDKTGGLDEEQLRLIQSQLVKHRMLTERKQTILRSIESQGKLTEKLAKQILSATTTKRLEDLYLPFKPKKQTLATAARSRGLEPLAREILEADPLAADLDRRAADFVNTDRQVPTPADALLGAGHILAEMISERAELRQRLREIVYRSGKLVSSRIASDVKPAAADAAAAEAAPAPAEAPAPLAPEAVSVAVIGDVPAEFTSTDTHAVIETLSSLDTIDLPESGLEETVDLPADEEAVVESRDSTDSVIEPIETSPVISEPIDVAAVGVITTVASTTDAPPPPPRPVAKKQTRGDAKKQSKADRKAEEKKKKEERIQKAFADYYDYREDVRKVPPHRVLAINRGERARVLRVKVEVEIEPMFKVLDELVVPAEHPHAEFLRGCSRDALSRLILPSLERELRREMTEKAETHAVGVFAKNLRNLLLQPPIRDRRTLAVDPGFKSGCKLAALDQFGNLLEHAVIYLVGKDERRQEAAAKIVDLMTRHELQVIVIGNGTGCRETEDFIGNLISSTELAARGVSYVIVNEAGASVYSTSREGREEFPQFDASVRGAISIGRRLQDPLSELVKIDAANIGVGLYQHDVKSKHLSASLDHVVESCVNFVGVDVNSASPALLRYVSGLNQLTARRLYEFRCQNGPFRTREQFKDVPGFGEATFVQAAGFLKIVGGDNPFDATWIHPESYAVTRRLLEKIECTPDDLANKENAAKLAERTAGVDLAQMAKDLEVGSLTLKDILAQLVRPGRDPREDLPKPVFKQGVLKLEDLTPGMELTGTILNVVDFGAFCDIGVHHTGLVHVSQLANRFIRDPHEVVAVGDIVKVWVIEVDKQRRRVSLTMIPPGTPRQEPHRAPRPEGQAASGERPPREGRPARPPREGRPPRPPRPPREGTPAETADGAPPPPKKPFERKPFEKKPYEKKPFEKRPDGRPPRGKRFEERQPRYQMPPKPPKPLPPITDDMKTGKSPLRTFGDLMQFYQFQQDQQKAAATGSESPQESPPPAPPEQKPQDPAPEPPKDQPPPETV